MNNEQIPTKSAQIEKMYLNYASKLFGYCYSLLRDRTKAEDIVSHTFMKMLELEEINETTIKAWLFKVARNQIINEVKLDYRSVAVDEGYELPEETQSNIEQSINDEMVDAINSALLQLRPEYREVIILKVREDYKFNEIAGLLEISVNTAKSNYYRGLEEIKTEVGKSKQYYSIAFPLILSALTAGKNLPVFGLAESVQTAHLTNLLNNLNIMESTTMTSSGAGASGTATTSGVTASGGAASGATGLTGAKLMGVILAVVVTTAVVAVPVALIANDKLSDNNESSEDKSGDESDADSDEDSADGDEKPDVIVNYTQYTNNSLTFDYPATWQRDNTTACGGAQFGPKLDDSGAAVIDRPNDASDEGINESLIICGPYIDQVQELDSVNNPTASNSGYTKIDQKRIVVDGYDSILITYKHSNGTYFKQLNTQAWANIPGQGSKLAFWTMQASVKNYSEGNAFIAEFDKLVSTLKLAKQTTIASSTRNYEYKFTFPNHVTYESLKGKSFKYAMELPKTASVEEGIGGDKAGIKVLGSGFELSLMFGYDGAPTSLSSTNVTKIENSNATKGAYRLAELKSGQNNYFYFNSFRTSCPMDPGAVACGDDHIGFSGGYVSVGCTVSGSDKAKSIAECDKIVKTLNMVALN